MADVSALGGCEAGTADICGVDIKTVQRFQKVAAQRAQAPHEQVTRERQGEGGHLDEMHSKLRRRRGRRGPPPKPRLVPPRDLFYGQVVKGGARRGTLLRVVSRVVYGGPRRFIIEMAARWRRPSIQTAVMERWYGTRRGLCAPLRRRTRCGSSSQSRHHARGWWLVGLDNFVLPHKSLRQQGRRRTPARAIGLAEHVWS